MKTVIWLLTVGLLFLSAGCAGNSRLNGKWLGSVTEKNKVTKVVLNLQTQGDAVAGTFTLFENPDDKTGTTFPLINARITDNMLEFTVPISGQIDADAVFFALLVGKQRLEGVGREMRKGSRELPAVFVKQK